MSRKLFCFFIVFCLIGISGCNKNVEKSTYNENTELKTFLENDLKILFDNNEEIILLLNEIKFNQDFIYIDKTKDLISKIDNINIEKYISELEKISVLTNDEKEKEANLYWLNKEKVNLTNLKLELQKNEIDYSILEKIYNELIDINNQL